MIEKATRLHQPGWLSGAIHFLIIYGAIEAESSDIWPYALLAIAAVSFCTWAANYRRYRQIRDLPTSKVASAAQGYVELFGRAQMIAGEPVRSRLSAQDCCWYSFQIEERTSDKKWRTVDSGRSVEHFLLADDTGECVISPEGAEVLTSDYKSWEQASRRYTECLLLPASTLYAIGEFSTSTASPVSAREERSDVSALLAEWKRDPRRLKDRFDLNRDGTIDLKEWELARLQAQREVRKRHAALPDNFEGMHLLQKPRDGRLFLIANELPEKLGARYRLWSLAHLCIFLVAGSAGLLML
jgi:hypothetical protein